jgi:UDP-N-acetylenolpyruvoylglucosamine reductase
MDSYATVRKASQPREPSAGCIFKNPEGDYAGKLIDAQGLKGLRVGDAEVSAVHGNFIVNKGSATAADVIELVRQVRAKIFRDTGRVLEPEVLLLGQDWDEVLGDPGKMEGGSDE